MGLPLKQLEAEALELTPQERAQLAHRLIVSLDDDVEDDPAEVERAWEAEIRRRLAEVEAGTAELNPAEDVFAELRRRRAALDDEADAGEPWQSVLARIETRDG